ncbi:uncharacterized protein [Macrobrachium rosenbergii]|uniref:uncharacterized protein n=1 Tax=Macrobrachium rosenbergii TaxID=79674 RepID=UPI0034D55EF2
MSQKPSELPHENFPDYLTKFTRENSLLSVEIEGSRHALDQPKMIVRGETADRYCVTPTPHPHIPCPHTFLAATVTISPTPHPTFFFPTFFFATTPTALPHPNPTFLVPLTFFLAASPTPTPHSLFHLPSSMPHIPCPTCLQPCIPPHTPPHNPSPSTYSSYHPHSPLTLNFFLATTPKSPTFLSPTPSIHPPHIPPHTLPPPHTTSTSFTCVGEWGVGEGQPRPSLQ